MRLLPVLVWGPVHATSTARETNITLGPHYDLHHPLRTVCPAEPEGEVGGYHDLDFLSGTRWRVINRIPNPYCIKYTTARKTA